MTGHSRARPPPLLSESPVVEAPYGYMAAEENSAADIETRSPMLVAIAYELLEVAPYL